MIYEERRIWSSYITIAIALFIKIIVNFLVSIFKLSELNYLHISFLQTPKNKELLNMLFKNCSCFTQLYLQHFPFIQMNF